MLAVVTAIAVAAEPQPVEDLAYGEVLFHFYQQDYFTAIRQLLVAEEQGRLVEQAQEAELLKGGLSLSYGLHREADEIFRRLLDDSIEPSVRDRAWMYLGKIFYQRGHLEQARDALARLSPEAGEEVLAEARVLEALAWLRSGDAEKARALLQELEVPEDWEGYVRYNTAVAAIRSGDVQAGEWLLADIGIMDADDPETLALRDKANLVLGTRYLDEREYPAALDVLERVRLEGPMSNRALLGAGWAASETGDYRRALARWNELRGRSLFDPAVQEGALAVPFALGKLEAYGRAASAYEEAIAEFSSELTRLDEALASIREGGLIDELLGQTTGPQVGWFRRLENLPKSPATHYLPEFMAGHEFQESYKNLRDLAFLEQNLLHWQTSMDAFDDMLLTRRQAYEAAVPKVDAYLEQLDLPALNLRRDALRARLEAAEADEASLGLRTEAEDSMLELLASVKSRLDGLPDTPETEELRQKYRVFYGLQRWQIEQDYPVRRWNAEKSLLQLDDALEEARTRQASLEKAKVDARGGFSGYADRIEGHRQQVERLRAQVRQLGRAHAERLTRLAEQSLQDQRRRLELYRQQARFALAQMYDRAARRSEGGS